MADLKGAVPGRRAGSEPTTAPELAAWQQLAAAVLLKAVEDARARSDGRRREDPADTVRDARIFLASDGAAWLVAALDLPDGSLERIRAELPKPGPVQLGLWG